MSTSRIALRIGLLAVLLCTAGAHAQWESIGPGGGGWLWSAAVAPDDAGTIFIGCDVGGIYRSRDHGGSWRIMNDGLANYYVEALAVDPRNPQTVYAATRGGVHKSTDGGDHWTPMRTGFPPTETWGRTAPVACIAVNPADTRVLLAGVGDPRNPGSRSGDREGLYVSRDGAESWEFITQPPELAKAQVYAALFHPANPTLAVVATNAGVFRSTDGGATWAAANDGLPVRCCWGVGATAGEPGVVYLTFADTGARTGGVARSDDGARTWRVIFQRPREVWNFWRILADPLHPGTVYAAERASAGIFRTADGGATWECVTREDNVASAWFGRGNNATAFAMDPREPERLYYGNDMDLYATEDGGGSWRQTLTDAVQPATESARATWRGRGLETTCSSAVAVAPGHPSLIYLGYWDTGLWRSTDGGESWSWVTANFGYGKAAAVAIDPTRPWRAWVSFGRNPGPHRIWRTDDYGRDWHLVGYEATGLPAGPVFSLVVDPTSPPDARVLLAPVGGKGVFRSADGGISWQRIDEGIGDILNFTSITMDPSDPQRLFLGVSCTPRDGKFAPGGVFRSLDGGRTWARVGDIRERPRVTVAPSDPRVVYVAERDYSSVGKGGVYRSDDGGDTFRLVAERLDVGIGNLARTYIGPIVVDPRNPMHLFVSSTDEGYDVGCGKGVFESRDGGKTWTPRNLGLGNRNVHNMILDPNDPDRIYAGTGGDGFFRLGTAPQAAELPAPPESPAPPDPLCTTLAGWSCTADKLAQITVEDGRFWWGGGSILARMDTSGTGCSLSRRFDTPVDVTRAAMVVLRLRGRNADGTPLCISRMELRDRQGNALTHEADIVPDATWALYELPMDEWRGEGFDRSAVTGIRFEFWSPAPCLRPYELGVGGIAFR
jgi:photosystem II stability/assembly factor-like uncharacterized protein